MWHVTMVIQVRIAVRVKGRSKALKVDGIMSEGLKTVALNLEILGLCIMYVRGVQDRKRAAKEVVLYREEVI